MGKPKPVLRPKGRGPPWALIFDSKILMIDFKKKKKRRSRVRLRIEGFSRPACRLKSRGLSARFVELVGPGLGPEPPRERPKEGRPDTSGNLLRRGKRRAWDGCWIMILAPLNHRQPKNYQRGRKKRSNPHTTARNKDTHVCALGF